MLQYISQQEMILNCLGCFRFSNFIIKNGKYLLPSKPLKPVNGFIKFNMQNGNGVTNVSQKTKQNATLWRNLSEEEKNKYKASASQMEKYKKQVEEYEQKYIHPLKRVNLLSLVFKKTTVGKEIKSIEDSSQMMKEAFEKLSIEEKASLVEEARKKNQRNQAKMKKYLIPQMQWNTFQKFKNAHKQSKHNETTLVQHYEKYLQNQELKFKTFCDNHGIKPTILKRMIRKETKQKMSQLVEKRVQQEVNKKIKQLKVLDDKISGSQSKNEENSKKEAKIV